MENYSAVVESCVCDLPWPMYVERSWNTNPMFRANYTRTGAEFVACVLDWDRDSVQKVEKGVDCCRYQVL